MRIFGLAADSCIGIRFGDVCEGLLNARGGFRDLAKDGQGAAAVGTPHAVHYALAVITTQRSLIALHHHDLPAALRRMDQSIATIDAAVKAAAQALTQLEASLGPDHPDTAAARLLAQ